MKDEDSADENRMQKKNRLEQRRETENFFFLTLTEETENSS